MLEESVMPWRDNYISNRIVSTMRREFRPHTRNRPYSWSLRTQIRILDVKVGDSYFNKEGYSHWEPAFRLSDSQAGVREWGRGQDIWPQTLLLL